MLNQSVLWFALAVTLYSNCYSISCHATAIVSKSDPLSDIDSFVSDDPLVSDELESSGDGSADIGSGQEDSSGLEEGSGGGMPSLPMHSSIIVSF